MSTTSVLTEKKEILKEIVNNNGTNGKYNPKRVPSDKPKFDKGAIKNIIPKHCFERPLYKSYGYLFANIILCLLTYEASKLIDTVSLFNSNIIINSLLWIGYWITQGCLMTGLWVIGHECGHRGFSGNELVCDITGFIVHSLLFVPYFAWQTSHKKHHSNNANMMRDEVHLPWTKDSFIKSTKPNHDGEYDDVVSGPKRLANIILTLTLGWPMYLLFNTSGRSYPNSKTYVNHYNPWSPIFPKSNFMKIIIGDIGVIIATLISIKLIMIFSFTWFIKVYFVPYLIVNSWLVLITFLQHTDIVLPHYQDKEWDWVRGALATIDRDYGILNHVFHHIGDTHVLHHLFSYIPHYHAQEATKAIIPLLGDYYRYDGTPIAKATWKSFGLQYVDGKDVMWFPQNKKEY